MQNANDNNRVIAHRIHEHRRQRREHKLARAFLLPRTAALWKPQKRGGDVFRSGVSQVVRDFFVEQPVCSLNLRKPIFDLPHEPIVVLNGARDRFKRFTVGTPILWTIRSSNY